MAEHLPPSDYPWWVKLSMWAVPGRAGLRAMVALSVAAAVACVAYGFRDPRFFAGILFLFPAAACWRSIRWVDRRGDCEPDAESFVAERGVPMEYWIPCPCGAGVLVGTGSAGSTVRCGCGATVAVPALTELRRGYTIPDRHGFVRTADGRVVATALEERGVDAEDFSSAARAWLIDKAVVGGSAIGGMFIGILTGAAARLPDAAQYKWGMSCGVIGYLVGPTLSRVVRGVGR